ncbi:MAG: CoA transferase subunit A [Bacillota bacterium]
MNKLTTAREAVSRVKDGDVIMIGGFLRGGSPETLLAALLEHDAADLTIISNDSGTEHTNTIKVMRQGRVRHVKASYIGLNPITGQMLLNDPDSVELCPQGTLAERIRCGAVGIPGFLTPTGVGTSVEKNKRIVELNGCKYLLETALRANVALVHATIVDEAGNCFMRGSTKNFNALMPGAADYAIVEAERIVPVGELGPDSVTVPGILIDAIVKAGEC